MKIREWGIDEFIGELEKRAGTGTRYIGVAPYYVTGPDKEFMSWLAQKPPEWMQQLYGMLQDEAAQAGLYRLRGLKLVRLRDATFEVAANCFFGNEATDERVPTVDAGVFSSGRSKTLQEKSKKFLSDLGVRELGEAEEVELILKGRYTKEAKIPDDKTYQRDLKRFVALAEQQPISAKLFGAYYIFQGEADDWHTPSSVYLDQPYQQTDLAAYYSRLGDNTECVALHPRYQDCGISQKRITAFAKAVGVIAELPIARGACRYNPQWPYLQSVGGDRYTSPIDTDYYIPQVAEFLKKPSMALSRLIWRTLTSISSGSQYWRATYQRNNSWGARSCEFRLVHELRSARWVPQRDGQFVRPSDAMRQLLPEGFPFDAGNAGLKAVQFGAEVGRQAALEEQKDSIAKKAGFADASALERAQRFAALPADEQERFFAERERAAKAAIPDRDPVNPERRARNVADQAADAPNKESEIRSRSVSIGREDVKVEAEQYLRQHYRNADGEMTCQICKGPLPFKLDDGTEFFETVEFLPELRKRHFQNYLALCPNHSAMYRHANGSRGLICEMVQNLDTDELPVTLAQQDLTIYLSKIHFIDMKAVLAAELDLPPETGDECAA